MITPEEEVDLAIKIKKGDKRALDRLVKGNLRFVVSVAKQYQNQGLSLSDLINEGNLGLIKAATRFDETKGFKFISYAVWWIRQSILQALVEQARIVRLPLNKVGAYNKINKIAMEFEQENQRDASPEELAEILGVSVEDVNDYQKNSMRHVSVDAPIQDNEDATMIDLMVDKGDRSPDMDLIKESLRDEINEVLNTLTPRESEIIKSFFGLDGKAPMSLDEIAAKVNLTRERVRQIKERTIRRLRKASAAQVLSQYMN
jgi:RNA polymerase primary sigma factor